jgi:hypothetical protein
VKIGARAVCASHFPYPGSAEEKKGSRIGCAWRMHGKKRDVTARVGRNAGYYMGWEGRGRRLAPGNEERGSTERES